MKSDYKTNKRTESVGWDMSFEKMFAQSEMSFAKMWNELKTEIVEKAGDMAIGMENNNAYHNVLYTMGCIEAREYEESKRKGAKNPAGYTVTQNIVGDVNIKGSLLEKSAREMFEQITGHKVIKSLEELEREMQKRKGKAPFSDQEPIVVDEKVDIPEHIRDEAKMRGIRLAGFGIDVISSEALPKGVFYQRMGFPG